MPPRTDTKPLSSCSATSKVELDMKDRDGQTPLSLAAEEGHEAVVRLLLDRDADIETKDKHGLHAVVQGPPKRATRRLCGYCSIGVPTSTPRITYGGMPLLQAARAGHEAVVRLLLDRDADINAEVTEGSKPLLMAAR